MFWSWGKFIGPFGYKETKGQTSILRFLLFAEKNKCAVENLMKVEYTRERFYEERNFNSQGNIAPCQQSQ